MNVNPHEMKDCLEALSKAITQLEAHMHTTNAPIRPREALSKFNTSAPMMLGRKRNCATCRGCLGSTARLVDAEFLRR